MIKTLLYILLFLNSSLAYADISTGLVGWWKLDEGSGTSLLDSSGNANTGNSSNTPTWATGRIGKGALTFASASSQYITIASATNIPVLNASQTLSAWVNTPNTSSIYDIVVPTNDTSAGNQLRINAGNAQVSKWGGGITITGGAVSTNTWHMITWTHNSTGLVNTIYIDGVQSGSTTATTLQSGTPTTIYIGSYGGGEYFNGTIDDVRIYNRVLSAADVAQLYTYTSKNGLFVLVD